MDRSQENVASSSSSSSARPPHFRSEEGESNRGGSEGVLTDQGSRDSAAVIAAGMAAVLGPVVREFDERAKGAIASQNALESSINRLTRVLDKLLEDTPLPFVTQHAARLSLVRKRVLSLTSTLHVIQGRIDSMGKLLSSQASTSAPKLNLAGPTPLLPENRLKPEQMRSSIAEVCPVTTLVESSHSSNDVVQDLKVLDNETSVENNQSVSPDSSDSIVYYTPRMKYGERLGKTPSRMLKELGSSSQDSERLTDEDHNT